MSKKKGLKVKEVTKEHFSSGFDMNEPKFSRLVVRMIEGKHLLASDIETGKSDPVCFLWLGPTTESPVPPASSSPDFEGFGTDETPSFEITKVCPTTVDPIWNQDIVFPVDATNIDTFMSQKLLIYIRDEDKVVDGDLTTYDELGMLEILMKDFVSTSKAMKSSVVRAAQWYDLKKSPGMRKVEGSVKMTITLIIVAEDVSTIQGQFGSDAAAVKGGGGLGALLRASVSSSSDNNTRASFNSNMRSSYQGLPKRAVSASPVRRPSSAASSVDSLVSNNDRRARSAAPMRPRPRPMTAPAQQTVQEEYLDEDFDQNQEEDIPTQDKYNFDHEEEEEQEELIVLPKQFSNNKVLSDNRPINPKVSRYDEANNHDDHELDDDDLMHDLLADGPTGGDEGTFDELVDIGMKVGGKVLAATVQAASKIDTTALAKGAAQVAASAVGAIVKSATNTASSVDINALTQSAAHVAASAGDVLTKSATHAASSASELIAKSGQDLSKGMAAQGQALAKSVQDADKELYKQAQALDVGIPSGLKIAGKQPSQVEQEIVESAAAVGAVNAAKNVINKKEEVDVKAILAAADKKEAATAAVVEKKGMEVTAEKKDAPIAVSAAAVGKDIKPVEANAKKTTVDEKAVPAVTISDKTKPVAKDAPTKATVAGLLPEGKPIAKDFALQKEDINVAKSEAPPSVLAATATVAAKPIAATVPAPLAIAVEEKVPAAKVQPKQKSSSKEINILDAPTIGDQAIDEDKEELEQAVPLPKKKVAKQQQELQEPERQHPTPTANDNDNNQPAAGRGAAAARVLAELRKQREELQIGLAAITAATQQGLSSLNDRLNRLESAAGMKSMPMMAPDAGDEGAMPPSDNEEEEEQDDRGKKRNRNDDSKKTSNNNKVITSKSDYDKSNSNGNKNNKYSSQEDKKQSTKFSRPSSSSSSNNNQERSTSAGRSRSTSINNQNVTMPSRVRSDSSSEFREFRRRRILEQYTNSGSFDDRGNSSGSNNNSRGITNYNTATRYASGSSGGGMPDAQLIFRDGSGRVSSAQMSSPPRQQQQRESQQDSMFGPPPGPGDEALPPPVNNSRSNSSSNLRLSSSQPLPPINSNFYHPQGQQQQQYQPQSLQQQQMSPSKVQIGLNRDFCEALDRGGLDDVAQLLENSAAKPETLAVSTRNRVYDAISTLLMQRRHVERCLVWITALMRQSSQQHMASSLWSELTPHTQRDLQTAVKRAAQEASKRGVLASLLSSQVDRLMV